VRLFHIPHVEVEIGTRSVRKGQQINDLGPDAAGIHLADSLAGVNVTIDEPGQSGDLRYLAAEHVHCAGGALGGVEVRTADDESLGHVDGVLLDPAQRRVCYLVVHSPGLLRTRRYLLPVDAAPHVEAETGILRVVAHANEVSPARFDARAVRPFSPEDVVTAMFAPHAA
jgi:hypothetical protein